MQLEDCMHVLTIISKPKQSSSTSSCDQKTTKAVRSDRSTQNQIAASRRYSVRAVVDDEAVARERSTIEEIYRANTPQ